MSFGKNLSDFLLSLPGGDVGEEIWWFIPE